MKMPSSCTFCGVSNNKSRSQKNGQLFSKNLVTMCSSSSSPVVILLTLAVVINMTSSTISVPSSSSAETEFGLPIAELFITNSTENGSLRLITNVSDSEVVITEEQVLTGKYYNQIVMFCNASYPVEWIYEGDGSPRLHTGQFRTFRVFNNPATYEYSAVVALYQERYNEQQTGSYVCRSVEDPKLRVFYHLYFPGDFGFPSIRNRVIRTIKKSTFVTLPCKSTDPSAPMSLLKIFPHWLLRQKEMANLTDSKFVTYDPREGFQLNLLFRNPYGTYICESRGLQSFWKMDLVPPKDEEVLYHPRASRVSLSGLAERSQTFTCRAKESVTITLPTSYELGTVEVTTNFSYKYPHKAVLRLSSATPLTTLGSYFLVNCVTTRDRRTLHSWHLSNIETETISVTYDRFQRRMLCCNNVDLSPTYEFAPCETLTDCEITKSCFNGTHCRPAIFPAPKIVDAPKGCVAAQFPDTINTHVMRCSLGEKHEIHYITESVVPGEIIIYNGETPKTEKILRIKILQQTASNEFKVKCVGKAFFFSLNFVFALEKYDGSFEYIDDDSVDMAQTYTPILRKTLDQNVKSIYCFAPLTRTTAWRNVSVTVDLGALTTTTTTTTALPTPLEQQALKSSAIRKRLFQRKEWKPKKST